MVEIKHFCSWCKKFLYSEQRDDLNEDIITHGMCDECKKSFIDDMLPKLQQKFIDFSNAGLEDRAKLVLKKIVEYESALKTASKIEPLSLMRLVNIKDPNDLLKKFKPEELVLEHKYDGWKVQIIKDGNVRIYSRKGDEKTNHFPEIIDKINMTDKTFLEGELVYWEDNKQYVDKITSIAGSKAETARKKLKDLPGMIRVHVYDILWYKGKNVASKPFEERRKLLEKAIVPNDIVKITKQYPFNDFDEAMKNAMDVGGEGVVIKVKSAPYKYKELRATEPKPQNTMYKYKGGIGKTDSDDFVVYDYVITEKGKMKAMFGQYYNGKLYKISELSNFSKQNADIIIEKLKDGPFVIEIGFQERLPKGLRHQKFIRFRDDKKPKDATMSDFHSKHIDKLKEAKKKFKISKRANSLTPSEFLQEVSTFVPIPKSNNEINVRTPRFPKAPANLNFDTKLGFKIISTLESGGKSHVVGDSGNSFGLTQVHAPYLLGWLSRNKNTEQITGLSSEDLKQLSDSWKKYLRQLIKEDIWKTVPVQKNVEEFISKNPNKVVKRNEGTTIRLNPRDIPGVIKKRGNQYVGQEIDLDVLRKYGFKSTPENMSKLQHITDTYITDRVVRSSIVRLLLEQDHPEAAEKFSKYFTSSGIRKNPNVKKLVDWAAYSDFANKMRNLISMVQKYGYDPTVPGAYNMYQLMAIANASGIYRVRRFLKDKKVFGPGHTTYLNRANPLIRKMTGLSTNVENGGLPGFQKTTASYKYAFEFKDEDEEHTEVDPFKGIPMTYMDDLLNDYVYLKENINLVREDVEKRYHRPFTDKELEQVITNTLLQKYRSLASSATLKNMIVKCAEYAGDVLYFPASYTEDIRAGKRRYSIRPNDINVKPNQIAKCKTYSGGDIADVIILSKEYMSIPRIEKAHGKMISEALQRRFGTDRQFVVVEFEPVLSSFADDDKMSEVLIDKDKKLTRADIKAHYSKPEIKKKIMDRIKDKPVMLFIGVEKNKNILKRNHNDKPIVITNDDPKKRDDDPHNYFYWVDRRVLSFHEVFGNKTDMGFVDLDLHGDFSKNQAQKYISKLKKEIKDKYNSSVRVYNSGGTGFHVEFDVPEQSIDKLRKELKDMLDELNKEYDNITTGIVKGSGMRTDITTLHNKGSLRVPGSIGENTGNVKTIVGSNNAEYIWTQPGRDNSYMYSHEKPFQDDMIPHPPRFTPPYGGGYVSAASRVDKEYIWLIDEDNDKFYSHLNIKDGKRVEDYYDHLTFGKLIGLNKITNEGWRGRIFIYNDNTADVQWYGDKNIKNAPEFVLSGIFSVLRDNQVKSFEYEQIVDWPSAEWRASGWYSGEKQRLLDKHMEKRKWMGFEEPDPEFIKSLDVKFASVLVLGEVNKRIFDMYNIHICNDINKFASCDGLFINKNTSIDKSILNHFKHRTIGINCSAISILPLVNGKNISAAYNEVGKIKRSGANFSRLPVEVDGNIVSSGDKNELDNTLHIFCNMVVKKKFADGYDEQIEEETVIPTEIEEKQEDIITPTSFLPEDFDDKQEEEEEIDLDPQEPIDEFQLPTVHDETPDTEQLLTRLREQHEEEDDEISMPSAEYLFQPPKNEDGTISSKWPEIEPIDMNKEERKVFSEKNLKNSISITKTFMEPKSWELLKKNPELAQNVVLPAIIKEIGKKWFENNTQKKKLGKELANTPFSMFSQEDVELIQEGMPFEDLPSVKAYIAIINDKLTEVAHKYFGYGYRTDPTRGPVPLGAYMYKALSRQMTKVIADYKGFKEKRVPVCSFCKGRVQKRQSNEVVTTEMELVPNSKPKKWICPKCSEQYNKNRDKINIYKQTIEHNKNKAVELDEALKRINNLLQEEPENTQLLRQKSSLEKEVIDLSNNNVFLGNNISSLSKIQYSLRTQSLGTPYFHTWCPNTRCPGNRVPLTALDLDNPFWSTEKGKLAVGVLKNRFGIDIMPSQSADDLPYIAPHRVPPEELLDVPFICPHDYIKFTLREAKYKGLNKKGGFLWEPYQKAKWEEEFGAEIEASDSVETDPEKVQTNMLIGQTGRYLSDLAKQLFGKQHQEELEKHSKWISNQVEIYKTHGANLEDAVEKVKKSKTFANYQRKLALYDTISQTSDLDENTFVSWMAELKMNKEYMSVKDAIVEANAFSKIDLKARYNEIHIPLLHAWVSKLQERQDWFEYYGMNAILANEKQDGIYSNGPGTFFIARVGDFSQGNEDVFGFSCNLVPDTREVSPKLYPLMGPSSGREPAIEMAKRPKTSAKKPKVLSFMGVWKIPHIGKLSA